MGLKEVYIDDVNSWPLLSKQDVILLEACKDGDLEKAKDALDKGANINASGVTREMKKSLIAGNEMWNLEQMRNTPPLGLAIVYKHPELAEYLIDRGADVNYYPQHAAAALRGYTKVLQKMIERGLDINQPETSPFTSDDFAINHAANCGDFETFDFLIKNGAKITKDCLSDALYGKNIEIIRAVMKARCGRLYDTDSKGRKHFVADSVEYLELLTKAGVDLKGNEKNGYPIAMSTDKKVIMALLDLGADRSLLDKNPFLEREEKEKIYKKWQKRCEIRDTIENMKKRGKRISGVVVAGKIAEDIISGKEKRTITPEVGKELSSKIKKEYALKKKQNG